MVIVQHFAGFVKEYIEAVHIHSNCIFPLPARCPHSACQAAGCLIRWGTYRRWATFGVCSHRIPVQRVRCKVCGRTHSLLPDFLHPHRQFVIAWLQHAVSLYLLAGLSWRAMMARFRGRGPARSTVREWVASFAYGAGHLLLEALLRHLLALAPDTQLPDVAPEHPTPHRFGDYGLDRVSDPLKRHRLEKAHTFWLLAEQLYAQVKTRQPRLHLSARQLFPFLLHWLQSQRLPARLFWSPALLTTPTQPF